MRALFLVTIAMLAVGCKRSGKGDAPCATVASRLFTLTRDELGSATVDAATRRAVTDQLPAMRDALTQICMDGKWSTQVRNCMVSAVDHVSMQTCQQQLTDEQRHALVLAASGGKKPSNASE